MKLIRIILPAVVSLGILIPIQSFAQSNESCERALSSPEDMSLALELVAEGDLDKILNKVPKLRLTQKDWRSLFELISKLNANLAYNIFESIDFPISSRIFFARGLGKLNAQAGYLSVIDERDPSTFTLEEKYDVIDSIVGFGWIQDELHDFRLSEAQLVDYVRSSKSHAALKNYFLSGKLWKIFGHSEISAQASIELYNHFSRLYPKELISHLNGNAGKNDLAAPLYTWDLQSQKDLLYYLAQNGDEMLEPILYEDWPRPERVKMVATLITAEIERADWPAIKTSKPNWLSTPERAEVIARIFREISLARLSQQKDRDRFVVDWMKGLFNAQILAKEVAEILLERNLFSTTSVFALDKPDGFTALPLNGPEGEPTLRYLARLGEELAPGHNIATRYSAFWDLVEDTTISQRLIRYYYEYLPKRKPAPEPTWFPKDSIELMTKITGISYEQLDIARQHIDISALYDLLLGIQEPFNVPTFADWKFEDSLFADRKLLDFMQTFRDVIHISGKEATFIEKLRNPTNVAEVIGTDQVEGLIESLKKKTRKLLQEILVHYDVGDFTYEQLNELTQQWGDIEPIITLLARFHGNKSWQNEIPELIQVFKRSLAGDFREYKYFSPEGRRQTEVLSNDKYESWVEDRYLLTLANEGAHQKVAEVMSTVREIVDTNLLVHAAAVLESPALKADRGFQDLLAVMNAGKPLEIIKKAELTEETAKLYLRRILAHFQSSKSLTLDRNRSLARFATALISSFPQMMDDIEAVQLKEDFKAIERTATLPASAITKDGMVFTALASDPKLLLTIGDVVDTSSCQNYSTGSVIQSLLGYVIDANVKALVSFHITSANFALSRDYEALFKALGQNQVKEVSWNGNRRIVYATLANGKTIESLPLGKAYIRQMVKLGQDTGTGLPAIFREREYMQNHPHLEHMRANRSHLVQELERDLGSTRSKSILMPQSRNPGGQYSDAASGVQTTEYEVNP